MAFGKARVALDTELECCREMGGWQADTNAITYLREWIQAGWLRELDDQIAKVKLLCAIVRGGRNVSWMNAGWLKQKKVFYWGGY